MMLLVENLYGIEDSQKVQHLEIYQKCNNLGFLIEIFEKTYFPYFHVNVAQMLATGSHTT